MSHELRDQIERLTAMPGQQLGKWARLAHYQMQLWEFCLRRLWRNQVLTMSAALSFRTIFALIPILVLSFVMLQSLGALDSSKLGLRQFLDSTGLSQIIVRQQEIERTEGNPPGETTEVSLATQLETLLAEVEGKLTPERIGPIGAVILVWAAMALVGTVEHSLNCIFEAKVSRSIGRRVMMYWSVVTLGPLLLSAAVYIGERARSTAEAIPGLSWMLTIFGWMGPILVGVLLLSALYKFMPNTHVSLKAAVGGAAVAVLFWLFAKWGFSIYLNWSKSSLYGAIGLLPLFLIWMNLSWCVFLFGAQLTHSATNYSRLEEAERAQNIILGPADHLAVALAVAQSFVSGQAAVSLLALVDRLGLPRMSVRRILDRLAGLGIICPINREELETEDERYVLARPAEMIRTLEVIGVEKPEVMRDPHRQYDHRLANRVTSFQRQARSVIGHLTLADLVSEEDWIEQSEMDTSQQTEEKEA